MDSHVRGPVVVGVDGSPGSLVAVELATAQALRRKVALRLVHGYAQPMPYSRFGPAVRDFDIELPLRAANHAVASAADAIHADHPDLTVEVAVSPGGPAAVLVEESRAASLLVVGARGHGGFNGLLTGSVAVQAAAHAHCPVIVARPLAPRGAEIRPVVVGVDGSPTGAAALAFAFEEAAAEGAPLLAVHVRQVPMPLDFGQGRVFGLPPTETADRARELLAGQLAGCRDRFPGVGAEMRVADGTNIAECLLGAAADARLLTVGCRGRGGFTGLLLGSVSRTLVVHAGCPVAVVHEH